MSQPARGAAKQHQRVTGRQNATAVAGHDRESNKTDGSRMTMREFANLLTADGAAALLSVSASTLKYWRGTGDGPAYVKLSGRQIRYRREDVEDFVTRSVRTSTAG